MYAAFTSHPPFTLKIHVHYFNFCVQMKCSKLPFKTKFIISDFITMNYIYTFRCNNPDCCFVRCSTLKIFTLIGNFPPLFTIFAYYTSICYFNRFIFTVFLVRYWHKQYTDVTLILGNFCIICHLRNKILNEFILLCNRMLKKKLCSKQLIYIYIFCLH